MIKKLPYINEKLADELIAKAKQENSTRRGGNSKAYVFDDYVVLETNVVFKKDETPKFQFNEDYMHTLIDLQEQGVAVVPVLGEVFDEENFETWGDSNKYRAYRIQPKADGKELWESKKMPTYNVNSEKILYLLERLTTLATAPQKHYDKFVRDYKKIEEVGIAIDPSKRENFFYDEKYGFSFIDLGEQGVKSFDTPNHKNFIKYCTVPCLWFATNELKTNLTEQDLQQIESLNVAIFEKCKNALLKVGVTEHDIVESFKKESTYDSATSIFGIENEEYISKFENTKVKEKN